MSDHKPLAAALAAVQGHMPSVHKGKTANVGQYRYTYADLADVSSAILPLLAENGLAFTCHPRRVEGGNTYELAATLLHTSGETIEGALPISGNQPQQIGSAITYGRRYLLGCLTGIVTDDDDDGQVHQRVTQQQKQTQQRREAKRETRQPQAEPPLPQQDTGEAIRDNTRKRLFALMGELVGTDEATQRAFLTDTLGRDVDSRASLTEAEGVSAGQRLAAWKRGEQGAAWGGAA